MFTNGWPPQMKGAASFTRVLGAGRTNIFEILRRRTLHGRRTSPGCCMSVGRVPLISMKLSRTSKCVAALLLEEHRHTGESIGPAYLKTIRSMYPPSVLTDGRAGDSGQHNHGAQLMSCGIFTKVREQPKPFGRPVKYRITNRPNRGRPASDFECVTLFGVLIAW